jgi:hypothetical protein
LTKLSAPLTEILIASAKEKGRQMNDKNKTAVLPNNMIDDTSRIDR